MRAEPRTATTDEQGRFELKELAAGEYLVMVRKPGYASLGYGQRKPTEPPRPLNLRAGEVFESADVALPRGGVVTGRVVDEMGEPVLEAQVMVMRHTWVRGRRRVAPTGNGITNDLGVYRIFGLAPGDYYVQARMRPWGADLDADYAPTFYPGAADTAGASVVTVAAGQESLADIALIPARVTKLSGSVLSSAGKPLPGGRVMATQRPETEDMVPQPRSTSIRDDGTFTITGMTPGTWTLTASGGEGFGPMDEEREFAQQVVSVGNEDVHGVTLMLARGATLRGRVTFQGTPPQDLANVRVGTSPADPGEMFGMAGGRPVRVEADGSFQMGGLSGRRVLLTFGAPSGWATKSVSLGGRDVQDVGIDFQPGRAVTGVEIVLSQEFAQITGQVTNDRGEAVKDYAVLVYSDDREKWFLPSGRWLKTVRADQAGQFKVQHLTAGRFLVVALEGLEAPTLGDPEELERLRPFATEITLTEREQRALQLKLVKF